VVRITEQGHSIATSSPSGGFYSASELNRSTTFFNPRTPGKTRRFRGPNKLASIRLVVYPECLHQLSALAIAGSGLDSFSYARLTHSVSHGLASLR
jgi:hypothetical protein